MKKFPEATLRKILEVANLEPEDRGDYFKVLCPSCGHKEAFVYKNNRMIVCSRRNKCNYTKDVIDYAKEEGRLKKDVLKSLAPQIEKKEEVKEATKLVLPEGLSFFSDKKDGIMYRKAYNYLLSRNIPKSSIEQLGYVYDPSKEFELGIFIPFFENNELVYYILRNVDSESKLRYDNPEGIKGSEFVYNYDKIEEGGTVCITEGVFDAISIENYVGTAMLTSSISKSQISKIFDKAPAKIIYIPDNDATGKVFTDKNIFLLNRYKPPSLNTEFYVYIIKEGYKDFNEYAKENGGFIDFKYCIPYQSFKRRITIKRKAPF